MTEEGAVKGSPARKGCLLTTVILVVGIAVGIGAGIGIGSGIWKHSGSSSGSDSPQRQWLFSLAASSGSLEISNSSEWKLALYGLNGDVVAFTNRPYREYATLSYQNMTDSMNEPSSEGSMNAVLAFNDGGNYIMAPIDIKSATLSDNGTTLTMGVVLLVDQQSDNTAWIKPMLNLMAKDGYLTQVGNSTYSLQLDQPYLFIDSFWDWLFPERGSSLQFDPRVVTSRVDPALLVPSY